MKLPPKGGLGSSSPEDKYIPIVYTRRGGFVLGTTFGFSLLSATGTPPEYEKRNDAFRVETGTITSIGLGQIFLGGAITDWFAFEFGLSPTSRNASDAKVGGKKTDSKLAGSDFLFRIETWPLFSRGGIWRDIGLGIEFGTGSANIKAKGVTKPIADGGAVSVVGINAFWDAARLWKLNVGPTLAFDYRTSDTYSQSTVLIGIRGALYTAP